MKIVTVIGRFQTRPKETSRERKVDDEVRKNAVSIFSHFR